MDVAGIATAGLAEAGVPAQWDFDLDYNTGEVGKRKLVNGEWVPVTGFSAKTGIQVYADATFKFHIPSPVGTGTIHRVKVRFAINASPFLASQVSLIPPDQRDNCPDPLVGFVFPDFYPQVNQIETDSGDDDAGYLLRLWDLGSGRFELEIVNKSELAGVWNEGNDTIDWIVQIFGLPDEGCELNLEGIAAFDASGTDVSDSYPGLRFIS